MSDEKVKLFLKESNAIEDVWDDTSLTQAEEAWDSFVKEDKLTVENILIAHKILMHGKLPIDERGHFRKCAVYVGRYEGKPYGKISELMTHWIKNANDVVVNGQKENEAFLEKIIKEHHVIFESIHPFIDGNGRIGRLIMNWQRVKVGLPILVILEKEKQDYYKWFK